MIKFISVGKVKNNHLYSLINEYFIRINFYHKIKLIEVKDEAIIKNLDDKIKNLEAERILKNIKDDDYVIALDLKGKSLKSDELSFKINNLINFNKNIVFVIGGSLGLSQLILTRANEKIKLSEMTFTHNMALLIILEQVYRAFKIIKNETYHK